MHDMCSYISSREMDDEIEELSLLLFHLGFVYRRQYMCCCESGRHNAFMYDQFEVLRKMTLSSATYQGRILRCALYFLSE